MVYVLIYISFYSLINKAKIGDIFMWKTDALHVRPFDETILSEGYLCVESYTSNFGPLNAKDNPYGRDLFADMVQFLKVHPGHPIRVSSSSSSHLHVWPAGDDKRMPAVVERDKLAYDVTTFILVPHSVDESFPKESDLVTNFNLKDVVHNNRAHNSSNPAIGHGKLSYLAHEMGINGAHAFKYSFIPPSQVSNHLFHWLIGNHPVQSHRQTFDQILEGEMKISPANARILLDEVLPVLTKRYGEDLEFKR
jgi:hypothetical protein